MTFGSLFSGIGGMDLGLERAGMECKWQVEIKPYATRVLEKHWPGVKRYGDIRTVTDAEPVDLIAGGFPCQDVSRVGARIGIEGSRSGLWSEYIRLVRLLRPRFVLVENVPGLLDGGIGRVLGDLAESGYDAEWRVLAASQFGHPHQRDRVFILADSRCTGQRIIGVRELPKSETTDWQGLLSPGGIRDTNGIPDWVDRVVACGNAVVPQIAEWIGRRILAAEAFWPAGVPRFVPCQNCNGTGVLNADATGHEHCEECGTTGRIKA